MVRLQATSREIALAADSAVEDFHLYVAFVAKREHAAIMAADPQPSSFSRFVDGAEGAPEEAVKSNGVILYTYERMAEVVQYAMEVLFELSPVDSGEYRNAHELFVSGLGSSNLRNWSTGMEVSISNRVPYARVIEIGKLKMRVPGTDQVYQRSRRKILARYGKLVDVQFTYRAIIEGHSVNQQLAASSGQKWWLGGAAPRAATGKIEKTLGKTAHNKANVRFPTLVIKAK